MKKLVILFIVSLFTANMAGAQEWVVPEDQKALKNPVEYNLDNVKKGRDLYMLNCKSCHGDPGKNNALPLIPPPPDITSDVMQVNTEGEIHYKITKGRGGMPQFETTLSDDDRWRLVNYIMNYNPGREPVLVEAAPLKTKLAASINAENHVVEISAEFENKEGNYELLAEAPILVGAKRAFGVLPLGQVNTNSEGKTSFEIPHNIVGDKDGNVSIVVSAGDGFEAEPVILEAAHSGTPSEDFLLTKRGVLWSTNPNTPLWLIGFYVAAVLGIWLGIGYVVLQILKIARLNKK